ncbi:hypothetical protein OsJ_30791 [Oryza sativa Japonica Group]|uniref:Uncharacterized protein n=1 Tax=Oryza sativa subsp. japonica TaxID=39947 RepID=B9G7L9_ORYSJ|nr:hypothetical protein OsJ_30791 [Oryza sativa Japonica Group]
MPPLILVMAALLLPAAADATSSVLLGINYGRVGNNLPPANAVPPMLSSLGVGRVRLYDADPATLRAFANTGVELVVGVPDECLAAVSTPSGAASWCLHDALAQLGLDKQVAVTTAHNLGVLATSYPPSSAYFRKDLLPLLCPILDFHARTGSPFLVNAYPYFAYAEDPTGVDAVYHAIAAANTAAARAVEVRVSETGWPSAGDANETGATPQNAARYNGNVMRLVADGKGTPLRPSVALRAYMFALFNENMKPGPTSERNYGLFKPDGTPVYELSYRLPKDNTNSGGGGGGIGGGSGTIGGGGEYNGHGEDGGYYSISASAKPAGWWTWWTQAAVAACVAVLMRMMAL